MKREKERESEKERDLFVPKVFNSTLRRKRSRPKILKSHWKKKSFYYKRRETKKLQD